MSLEQRKREHRIKQLECNIENSEIAILECDERVEVFISTQEKEKSKLRESIEEKRKLIERLKEEESK